MTLLKFCLLLLLLVLESHSADEKCSGEEEEKIKEVLGDVDWEELAIRLGIKSQITSIHTACKNDIDPAPCFLRKVIKRFMNTRDHNEPCHDSVEVIVSGLYNFSNPPINEATHLSQLWKLSGTQEKKRDQTGSQTDTEVTQNLSWNYYYITASLLVTVVVAIISWYFFIWQPRTKPLPLGYTGNRHLPRSAIPENEIGFSDTIAELLDEKDKNYSYPWEVWSVNVPNIERPLGSNFVIAIIDTGIKQDLDIFADKILLDDSLSFVDDTIEDSEGHGTACAGIAAGNITETFEGGVACDAKLLVCKVGNKSKEGFSPEKVIEALEYIAKVHKKKKTVHVVSMSFGFVTPPENLEKWINHLTLEGVICVASSGNQGNNPNLPVKYPAKFDNVISVGSHDSEWKLAKHCADPKIKGTKIDCTTLGVKVCGPSLDQEHPLSKHSGTSIATAVAAGLIACILEREFGLIKTHDKLERVKSSLKKMTAENNDIKPLNPALTMK